MIYPDNFEQKLGFPEIRQMLIQRCLSTLGASMVDEISFTDDASAIQQMLREIGEMRTLLQDDGLPLDNYFDVRDSLKRARPEGTFIETGDLFALKRVLETIKRMVDFLHKGDERADGSIAYDHPALQLRADGVQTHPVLIQQIEQIVDRYGNIRDTASPQLQSIRQELARTEGSISRILGSILHRAQADGLVERDVTPMLRDGRLMIPVAPSLKRRIQGIVHDESASGKTVFVEPTEVVEANNRIRELQNEERHEIIRILMRMTDRIRPHLYEIHDALHFLSAIDMIHAKARLAEDMAATEPHIVAKPMMDWIQARHPLLERKLKAEGGEGRRIVPLDMVLTAEQRVLIISGPNAGGKSVCLKTVGLLQYMLQCGLSIPIGERSKAGIFSDIMIDIGDEQSLENDLSTYSSHLLNMKMMMRQASESTLILIDEFGTGTEPQIGGALAEAILDRLCCSGVMAVITTHYQNLKHYADTHPYVGNAAMLYDRHEMKPLFSLAIGRPGSSFAIDIARKIGLPEEVISMASDIVGSDYIRSDKYLQDIVRDKRYWERKRENVHRQEKELQERIDRYEEMALDVDRQRKEIIRQAQHDAKELLNQANRKIELTVKQIREAQAEKEATKLLREELNRFRDEVETGEAVALAKGKRKPTAEEIDKKIEQIKARKARKEQNKKNRQEQQDAAAKALREAAKRMVTPQQPEVGSTVRMAGGQAVGQIEALDGKTATVIFGGIRTKVALSKLVLTSQSTLKDEEGGKTKMDELRSGLQNYKMSHLTQETIDSHKRNFHQDIDIRGMRGDEALLALRNFIDDAILMGMPRVRVLHGKGNGILRTLIRQYLSAEPSVSHFADEHVQFGGAGITVVDLE